MEWNFQIFLPGETWTNWNFSDFAGLFLYTSRTKVILTLVMWKMFENYGNYNSWVRSLKYLYTNNGNALIKTELTIWSRNYPRLHKLSTRPFGKGAEKEPVRNLRVRWGGAWWILFKEFSTTSEMSLPIQIHQWDPRKDMRLGRTIPKEGGV